MERINLREEKKKIRQHYRAVRDCMDPNEKARQDQKIAERLFQMKVYQESKTVLCFVSTKIEVETRRIIAQAFADGKTVAAPVCLDRNGNMDFFIFHSMEELKKGEFSLWEPDPKTAHRLTDYKGSVCILPALAFDPRGYRLGFGGGYYDRFLHNYTGKKIGVCYNSCIVSELPCGRFDKRADYIVTPKYVITVQKGKTAFKKEI